MPEQNDKPNEATPESTTSAATASPGQKPSSTKPGRLPPYKVLLHDDDINDMEHVVLSLLKVMPLSVCDAEQHMLQAHKTGFSLLIVTHRERAELYQEQLQSYKLTVSIEPDA